MTLEEHNKLSAVTWNWTNDLWLGDWWDQTNIPRGQELRTLFDGTLWVGEDCFLTYVKDQNIIILQVAYVHLSVVLLL